MKDTIYREDAIKAINLRARIPHDIASAQYASMAINAICSVPSADRPSGEWIDRGMRVPSSWVKKCSLCGHETDTWRWCKFCPNCGARMVKPDE